MPTKGAITTLTRIAGRSLTVGVAAIAAASLSIGTAAAADSDASARSSQTGQDTQTARKAAGNTSSTPQLTTDAKAAGRAAFGAAASDQQSLEAYWTPERMRAALPVEDSPEFAASVKAYEAKQRAMIKAGQKPVTNDGPERSFVGVASKKLVRQATMPKGAQAAYNPNLPYYVPTAYTNGKVFFSKSNGLNYVCSASIINSEGKDSVWTAGHCVHGGQGGTWHSNWTFVPAYDDDLSNPRPYGTWSAAYFSSRSAWTGSSDYSQDIGVATMNTLNGWHIVDYFGGQGITVNKGKNVWDNAFGYPAEWPFDGGNLMRCWGTTSPEWDAWLFWSQTVKIPCDMTRGSSGGPWLWGYDGNWGWLNGVNSRIDSIVGPTIMLSPYFDDDAWSLFNFTRWN